MAGALPSAGAPSRAPAGNWYRGLGAFPGTLSAQVPPSAAQWQSSTCCPIPSSGCRWRVPPPWPLSLHPPRAPSCYLPGSLPRSHWHFGPPLPPAARGCHRCPTAAGAPAAGMGHEGPGYRRGLGGGLGALWGTHPLAQALLFLQQLQEPAAPQQLLGAQLGAEEADVGLQRL